MTFPDWITIDEGCGLEGISRREMYNRLKPGDPNFVVSQKRRTLGMAGPGTMIHAVSLSPKAQEKLREKRLAQVQEAARVIQESPAPQPPETTGQMGMFPKTEIDMQILAIPPGVRRDLAFQRFRAIQPLLNEDYKALGYRSRSGLTRAIAANQGVDPDTVGDWVKRFNDAGGKIEALAPKRPGPDPGTGSVLDASMQAYIADCWQIRKLTKMQTYRSLNGYLRDKQRGIGTAWNYVVDGEGADFVSRSTVERYIEQRLGGEDNPWRRGGTAIKDAAGYIDRIYDECAGDAWCIDEWELDGIFYEPANHSMLVQNPHAYLLSVIDERTTRILGRKLARSLCPDAVLELLEETIRKFGKPRFFGRDKGSHFRSKVGGRVTVRKHGELVEVAIGALGKLGVEIRSPGREKNPRGNRIERLHHIYSDLARRDFGPSWCGTRRINRDGINLREVSGIDERIPKHFRDHCQLGICGPVLLSMDDAERITAGWAEEINMLPTAAKGCDGMTRIAAYNYYQPSEAERLARKISKQELVAVFSEDYEVTVREGGVIVIPGKPFPIRYSHTLLTQPEFKGKKMCVTRTRHDKSFVMVFARKGEPPLRADRRDLVGLNDLVAKERGNIRLARVRKVYEQSARPVIDLSADWQDVEAVHEPPRQEICGTEFTGEKMGLKKNLGVVPEPVKPEPQGIGFADLEE